MPSFWQVVYRYVPWLEKYIDRASAFVRTAAFKGVVVVVACLALMVLLLPRAEALVEHPDGTATFTNDEMIYILSVRQELERRVVEAYAEIERLNKALKQEQSKRCI